MSRIPVNVLTGFLGSGKTTLLQRLLRSPQLARTAVLINELGEIGLDHLLVERVDEAVVLLKSGCICCTIRDDLKAALRDLLSRRERGDIPEFDRVVIETTGVADPGPILYTLCSEPVVRHHFHLAAVITTVDAVNASLHLDRNPEGVKQVAAADRLAITKTDLVDMAQTAAVQATLRRLNASAQMFDAADSDIDAERLLASAAGELPALQGAGSFTLRGGAHELLPPQGGGREEDGGELGGVRNPILPPAFLLKGEGRVVAASVSPGQASRHSASVASLSLAFDDPLDWTAFGIWLSMLLNRHGENVLRVKGILQVEGASAPVLVNAVQHIVHPPQHLERWPSADRRSRIVFITRGIDHGMLRRSLAAFTSVRVVESSCA